MIFTFFQIFSHFNFKQPVTGKPNAKNFEETMHTFKLEFASREITERVHAC